MQHFLKGGTLRWKGIAMNIACIIPLSNPEIISHIPTDSTYDFPSVSSVFPNVPINSPCVKNTSYPPTVLSADLLLKLPVWKWTFEKPWRLEDTTEHFNEGLVYLKNLTGLRLPRKQIAVRRKWWINTNKSFEFPSDETIYRITHERAPCDWKLYNLAKRREKNIIKFRNSAT